MAGNVQADPQPWMKKDNPDELAIWVQVSNCPGVEDETDNTGDDDIYGVDPYEALVRDVLVRSRVKAKILPSIGAVFQVVEEETDEVTNYIVGELYPGELFLYAILFCAPENQTYYYNAQLHFAYVDPDKLTVLLFQAPGYATFGLQTQEGIIDAFKTLTENAVTDYLKANFDL